jgi:ferredoxin
MTDDLRAYSLLVMPLGCRADAPADATLLQSARAAGIRLPSSCRNGTCRACLCKLLQGEIRYRIEWPGLSREEKLEGWVLPCVAYPAADVVLAAPAAERSEG